MVIGQITGVELEKVLKNLKYKGIECDTEKAILWTN